MTEIEWQNWMTENEYQFLYNSSYKQDSPGNITSKILKVLNYWVA